MSNQPVFNTKGITHSATVTAPRCKPRTVEVVFPVASVAYAGIDGFVATMDVFVDGYVRGKRSVTEAMGRAVDVYVDGLRRQWTHEAREAGVELMSAEEVARFAGPYGRPPDARRIRDIYRDLVGIDDESLRLDVARMIDEDYVTREEHEARIDELESKVESLGAEAAEKEDLAASADLLSTGVDAIVTRIKNRDFEGLCGVDDAEKILEMLDQVQDSELMGAAQRGPVLL